MTTPDGLDREAIKRRAERAKEARANSAFGVPGRWVGRYADDVPALLAALRAAEAEVERSALVQVGWFHGDGVNVTAFRPSREGEPAHPDEWSPVYVLRTEGGAS